MASELETLLAIGKERNPVQETRFKELSAQQGNVPSGPDFGSTVQRAIELNRQAVQPAVQSLQASIPEVQKKFETQRTQLEAGKEPLKQRYASLLADVKGRAQASEEAQTRVTSGELGKRGIVGSSTLAQQEIQSAVEPIRSGARTAITEIGLGQEEGLRGIESAISNLTGLETDQVRAVTNAIAQLQAGAGQTGLQQGFAQESAQLAAEQQAQQLAEERALADRLYNTVTLPESQANIANTQSTIANRGAEAGGLGIADFLSLFGGGQQTAQLTGFSNVDKLLAEGRYDEARQLLINP